MIKVVMLESGDGGVLIVCRAGLRQTDSTSSAQLSSTVDSDELSNKQSREREEPVTPASSSSAQFSADSSISSSLFNVT